MRIRFDEQLDQMNDMLIEMGSLIERSIEMAVKALMEHDALLAQEAIDADEEINEAERNIESVCLKMLLHQQPIARDLRLISTALKMIPDMERIGDQAADIAEISLLLADEIYIKELLHIPQMAQETISMVSSSIDAYVKHDMEIAEAVIAQDDIVDDLFVSIKKDLIELIHEDSANGEQALDLLMIAKYFERIGDHAVNIAEWVIFSITGQHKNTRIL
ncbi:MAG: phosphate signaling complex protein PhoU [Clostridiales Family XIII bacterium]|nr:phosphate signaling complex protein PhoU [Clostridiales Family XIII bacterium]